MNEIVTNITRLGDAAFPWFQERNAHEIREDTVRARESIDLANLGFTTGRAHLATVPRGSVLPSFNLGGGSSGGLGSLGAYAPLALLALVAVVVLKK